MHAISKFDFVFRFVFRMAQIAFGQMRGDVFSGWKCIAMDANSQ